VKRETTINSAIEKNKNKKGDRNQKWRRSKREMKIKISNG
jgi:hypothetical protein